MSELKTDKNFERWLECMARGILVGGSLGAIAGWFLMDIQRPLLLGMLIGCLAGVTMKNVKDSKDREAELNPKTESELGSESEDKPNSKSKSKFKSKSQNKPKKQA